MANGFWHLPTMSRFVVVGGMNTLLDFCVFAGLHFGFGWQLLAANSCAYVAATVNSFILNRSWTFADSSAARKGTVTFTLFVVFNLLGLGLANAVILAMSWAVPTLVAKASSVLASMLWNYWANRQFVFPSGT